jgi:hypothetical protein
MNKYIVWYLLALGFVIIIIAFSFFIAFYGQQPFYKPVHRFLFNHSHRYFTVNDINRIQSWMTFDYINKVFRLPTSYLESFLHISDSHYPNMLISQYAS